MGCSTEGTWGGSEREETWVRRGGRRVVRMLAQWAVKRVRRTPLRGIGVAKVTSIGTVVISG